MPPRTLLHCFSRVTAVTAVIALVLVLIVVIPAYSHEEATQLDETPRAAESAPDSIGAEAATRKFSQPTHGGSSDSDITAVEILPALQASDSDSSSTHTARATSSSFPRLGGSGSESITKASSYVTSQAGSGNSSAPGSTTTTTTTASVTPIPMSPSTKDNGDGGAISTFVFVLILIFIVCCILHGSRVFPFACPFFRGGGVGSGSGRGRGPSSHRQQQYARLDGGVFYEDEEDYRGMEPSSAARGGQKGDFRAYNPMHGQGDGRGDVIVEMQEKLKGGDAGVTPPMGRVTSHGSAAHSPFPQQQMQGSAVQVSGVVDDDPAALDALLGGLSSVAAAQAAGGLFSTNPGATNKTPSPTPPVSKNSLKAMRKGKLGHATGVSSFGAVRSGDGGCDSNAPQGKGDWGWSDDDDGK